jgi:hypothetical protein
MVRRQKLDPPTEPIQGPTIPKIVEKAMINTGWKLDRVENK